MKAFVNFFHRLSLVSVISSVFIALLIFNCKPYKELPLNNTTTVNNSVDTAWKQKEVLITLRNENLQLKGQLQVKNGIIKAQADSIETQRQKIKYIVVLDTGNNAQIIIDSECKADTIIKKIPYPVVTIVHDTVKQKDRIIIQKDYTGRDRWRNIALGCFICVLVLITLGAIFIRLK